MTGSRAEARHFEFGYHLCLKIDLYLKIDVLELMVLNLARFVPVLAFGGEFLVVLGYG